MERLHQEYFEQEDVVALAKDLLGKVLITNLDGITCSGYISETEAYAGIIDKASHAFGGKRTKRTEVMYANGGHVYVYLCYGIHKLFNIVTNRNNVPHAVLIRGLIPKDGIKIMRNRLEKAKMKPDTINGPGKVTKALGIELYHNHIFLPTSNKIWIEKSQFMQKNELKINIGIRIGVDYADEDKNLPYRFFLVDNNLKIFPSKM